MKGVGTALGVHTGIISPTFSLEQRYEITQWVFSDDKKEELIHIDLYRLTAKEAQELLRSTDDHHGIRCIEWWENAERPPTGPSIHITFAEEQMGRSAQITFDDAKIPTHDKIENWRQEMRLPEHIRRHCDAVADLCDELSAHMLQRGIPVRQRLLRAAAEVHDLLRFLDFRPGGYHAEKNSPEELAHWEEIRTRYPGLKHEPACAAFLRSKHFDALATIVAVHGLTLPSPTRRTIEQQLLFYADKRVNIDRRVSLEERFADFATRYSDGKRSADGEVWYKEAKAVEEALFQGRCPV
jgi:tRNA A37 threonylcarbamoyladenosine biosynthesis protein TsaE